MFLPLSPYTAFDQVHRWQRGQAAFEGFPVNFENVSNHPKMNCFLCMLRIFIRLPEIKQRYEYRIQETLRYFRGLVGCDSGGNLMNRGWAGGGESCARCHYRCVSNQGTFEPTSTLEMTNFSQKHSRFNRVCCFQML